MESVVSGCGVVGWVVVVLKDVAVIGPVEETGLLPVGGECVVRGVGGWLLVAEVVVATGVPVPLLVVLAVMVVEEDGVVSGRCVEEACELRDVEVVAVLNELWAWLVPLVVAVIGGAVCVVPVTLIVVGTGTVPVGVEWMEGEVDVGGCVGVITV